MTANDDFISGTLSIALPHELENPLGCLIAAMYPTIASVLRRHLMRVDVASSTILAAHVLGYMSVARPTVERLYDSYHAEVLLRNGRRGPDEQIYLVSSSTFGHMIEYLDAEKVWRRRYGRRKVRPAARLDGGPGGFPLK